MKCALNATIKAIASYGVTQGQAPALRTGTTWFVYIVGDRSRLHVCVLGCESFIRFTSDCNNWQQHRSGAEGQHWGLLGDPQTYRVRVQLQPLPIKTHIKKTHKRSSVGKEKLLGISMWLRASKMSSLRLNVWAQGSAGCHGSHVCCRVVSLLGTHGSDREETLLTLYLLHVSFNPSRNRRCPLKGRGIRLTGAKTLSPSEMPQSLSTYNTAGQSNTWQAQKLSATLELQ